MLIVLVLAQKGCGHFQQVSVGLGLGVLWHNFTFLKLFVCSSAPKLELFAERTDTYIKLAFGNAMEDTGQLTYKVEGAIGGRYVCNADTSKCDVTGLRPGTKYSLKVKACISAYQSKCGDSSNALGVFTLPGGEFEFHVVYSVHAT